jgi:hypothetical protein
MRTSQLRALVDALRAGGVSEYTATRRGETVSLKLGALPSRAEQSTEKRAPAKAAAQPFPAISSALRKQMEDLGVDPDQAHEVALSVLGAPDGGS